MSLNKPMVIADRSWLVLEGLTRLIAEIDPTRVIHTAADEPEFLQTLRGTPDLATVLVGTDFLAEREADAILRIRALAPEAAIVVLSGVRHNLGSDCARQHGAQGIINLHDSRQDVAAAIEDVIFSDAWTPSSSAGGLQEPRRTDRPTLEVLTRRERDVFTLLGRGLSVPLIADHLTMSPHTARVHVTRIMKKLDLRDRSALMHCAVSSLIRQ